MAFPDAGREADKELDELCALFTAHDDAVSHGDVKAAAEEGRKALQFVTTMSQDSSPWLAAMTEAHRCEAAFDWAGAEAAYQHGVDVTADSPMGLYGAYRELSAFYRLCGRYDQALDAAQRATDAARQMGTPMMVPIALHVEAVTHFRLGNYDAASEAVTAALQGIGEGPHYDLHRVLVLTARARCFLEQGACAQAQADLQTVWEWAAPWADEHDAGGWQAALAEWWATTARLRARQGDAAGTVDAWRQSIARCRIRAAQFHLAGPYANNHLALALEELGKALPEADAQAAAEAFAESRSLRQAIGLPPADE